jgi:hypothetical protein
MLDSVRSILSSGRPDDAISGELAELLGFDELDLVSDILSNRGQFLEEPMTPNEPTLTSHPSKGKGKEIGGLLWLRRGKSLMRSSQIREVLRLIKSEDAWKNSCRQMRPDLCLPVPQSVTSLLQITVYRILRKAARKTRDSTSRVHFSLEHGRWRYAFSVWK